MQEQQQKQSGSDARMGLTILFVVLKASAMSLIPFLRSGWGINVPGNIGVASIVLIFFSIAATRDAGLLWFLGAWFCALVLRRIQAFQLYRSGRRLHSQYWGDPVLVMRLFPFANTDKLARDWEPFFCFVVGILFLPVSRGVGQFVALGGVSLLIVRFIDLTIVGRQITAMNDFRIEQRAMSERMRR